MATTYTKNPDGSTTVNDGTYGGSVQPTIDATALGKVKPFNLPTAPTTTQGIGLVDNYYAKFGSNLEQVTARGDLLEKQAQDIGGRALDISQMLGGQTQDLMAEEKRLGVETERKNVLEAKNQLGSATQRLLALQRQAAIAPEITQQESIGRGRTQAGIAPLDMAKQRELAIQAIPIAIEADIANYRLTGSQESLKSAQEEAKRLVDLKYEPYKQELKTLELAYNMNKDMLESVDKKRADALGLWVKDKEAEYNRKIEEEKQVAKLLIDASPVAPPDVLQRAKDIQAKGGSGVEVAIALGKYGGDYLGDLVKRSTIAKNDADYEKTMKEIKLLGQAPQVNAPAGTNANFIQNLAASAVNKESLTQTERTAVTKNLTVLDQLDSLQQNIAKQNNTGFIKGKVNNLLAAVGQNADVGTINAQLQAIVPNLARGVYGEVGVLTDNDIANYRKTLPLLTMPKDQNDAILALTLKVVQKNLKNTLDTAANSKMDVSRFAPKYQEVTNKINEINDRIGVSKQEVLEYGRNNPQAQQMIADLSAQGLKPSEILQVLGVEN